MAGLKVLGIDHIRPRIIFESLATLLLLSISANSLFELWKLLPTVFFHDRSEPDWWSWFLYLFPVFCFGVWLLNLYRRYHHLFNLGPSMDDDLSVSSHKGIVIALSRPSENPESINEKIDECNIENVVSLFPIQSIGQLFKGIYYHKDELRYIWLVRTKESLPYEACLAKFISRFMQDTKIVEPVDTPKGFIIDGQSDLELIENTKIFLSSIYSNKNLEAHNLNKSDIIVDVTGGTKSITIGMIFGAIDTAIDIQYMEQRTQRYDVIPLRINHEIILDKTSEYLGELYSAKKQNRIIEAVAK